ncbi:uncharacterized protein LOC141606254 isoform X2 [Silene latifolia]|uniref:uncharacterized protein LOC141606254 isoform X2 n=1 Tax=Silene latifolia TaxID=37657 RepID=UPI003D781560
MAELVVIELLETIGEQVGSEICEIIAGAPDIDSQIKNLQDLKNIIEATLVDADSSQVSSHSQLVLLEKLELGLAKLIDFQDADSSQVSSNFNKEARLFFSNPNQIVSSFKDPRKTTLSNEWASNLSTDMVIGRDGDGVKVAGGSDVENDLESGSDSDSDSSLSELMDMFQKPETVLVHENQQIHISVLVNRFITEGLLGRPTMAAYKKANDIVGLLVKASLLEASNETMMVRMHNMIRDSALAILPFSREGRQMFFGHGLRKLGTEQVDKYLIKIGDQLKEPPPLEEWEKATIIFLMDHDFSTLPYCPTLVSLFLQRNRYLRVIPASFFDSMHSLTNLNLSQTRIRSLPDSLFTLKSLQVLLMRDCEHLIILPSAIGKLTALEVLDLQGTELLNLPDTISELVFLKILKVSFYGSINHSECNNLPRNLIGEGTISNLPLEELAIFVQPGDRRWTISVSDISKEVADLLLTTLYFHFPELESLEYFLRGSQSWKIGNVMSFNFIVGHDFKHALSLVTRDAELMHSNSERCLRFVNGETIPQGVMEVLKRATSLYLDHHFKILFLSSLELITWMP